MLRNRSSTQLGLVLAAMYRRHEMPGLKTLAMTNSVLRLSERETTA